MARVIRRRSPMRRALRTSKKNRLGVRARVSITAIRTDVERGFDTWIALFVEEPRGENRSVDSKPQYL